VREWLKREFSGEIMMNGGTAHHIGRSTKGQDALQRFLERAMDWLVENYAPPQEALDPARYKVWRDTVF
jgi:hypothetical protein